MHNNQLGRGLTLEVNQTFKRLRYCVSNKSITWKNCNRLIWHATSLVAQGSALRREQRMFDIHHKHMLLDIHRRNPRVKRIKVLDQVFRNETLQKIRRLKWCFHTRLQSCGRVRHCAHLGTCIPIEYKTLMSAIHRFEYRVVITSTASNGTLLSIL